MIEKAVFGNRKKNAFFIYQMIILSCWIYTMRCDHRLPRVGVCFNVLKCGIILVKEVKVMSFCHYECNGVKWS